MIQSRTQKKQEVVVMSKIGQLFKRAAAVGLCAVAAATTQAAITPPAGQAWVRPLTPQEIKGGWNAVLPLPSTTQKSAGLFTVGIGSPVYMEVQMASMVVTQVTWTVTNRPPLSTVALAESPLTNLTVWPIYDVGQRNKYFVPTNRAGAYLQGRKVLVPDIVGQYVVVALVTGTTTGAAPTAATLLLTNTITAARYLGVDSACAYCHDGNGVAVNDNLAGWLQTAHSDVFQRKIDGSDGPGFKSSCYSCHVTGYDTAALAVNDGFDDVLTATGWLPMATTNVYSWTNSNPGATTTVVVTFTNTTSGAVIKYTNSFGGPVTNVFEATNVTTYTAPGNWASMPVQLQDKANVQCETCHGPASQHNGSTVSNKIDVGLGSGVCASCHDSKSHHFRPYEWSQSAHGSGTHNTYPWRLGQNANSYCFRCHSGKGFIDLVDGDNKDTVVAGDEGITCAVCHDPHAHNNAHQIRTTADIVLGPTNGPVAGVITGGGLGKLCMQCHRTRYTSAVVAPESGVHDSPVADLLAGTNAVTYGGLAVPGYPNPHYSLVPDTCITCHMQELEGDATYGSYAHTAQGHTMKMTTTNGVEVTKGCLPCHEVSTFDFSYAGVDYDGNGTVEGVQTEVTGLLSNLAMMLPPVGSNAVARTSNYNTNQNMAYYNYSLVNVDGSRGVHNPGFAVAVLKASIADMQKGWNSATNQAPAGWRGSEWFGRFYPTGNNGWLYHAEHGWMYASFTTRSSIWLWTSDMGWLWTSETVYPFLYRWNDSTWLWYQKGGVAPNRLFYKYSAPAGWEAPR